MAVEIVLGVLAVVLFGGMFLGLASSFFGEQQPVELGGADATEARSFFAQSASGQPPSHDGVVLSIEHYLRRERLRAQRFVSNPRGKMLPCDEDHTEELVDGRALAKRSATDC